MNQRYFCLWITKPKHEVHILFLTLEGESKLIQMTNLFGLICSAICNNTLTIIGGLLMSNKSEKVGNFHQLWDHNDH